MPSSDRPRRLAPAARRLQLLRATEELIEQRGTSDLTLEEIAGAAGVTVQLLYRYFPGRDALISACLDRIFERFDADVATHIAQASTFDEKMRVLCRQVIDPLPSLSILAHRARSAADAPGVTASLDRHAIRVALFVAYLIEDELKVPHDRALMAAAATLGAAQAFSSTRAVVGWDADRATDELVTMCRGLIYATVTPPQ